MAPLNRREFLKTMSAAALTSAAADAEDPPQRDKLELRPAATLIAMVGGSTPVAFVLYNGDHGAGRRTGSVKFTLEGGVIEPASVTFDLPPAGWKLIFAQAILRPGLMGGTVSASAGSALSHVTIRRGLDLTTLPWKRRFVHPSPDTRWAGPDLVDREWETIRVPALWDNNDDAWLRAHVVIPSGWRGHPLRLVIGAVDDNDVTYLNGEEIGRTNGWDVLRDYPIPDRLVRWDLPNVIAIRVENPSAGGGLYKTPILLLTGDAPLVLSTPAPQSSSARPAPGTVGAPHPLRALHVDHGVLRYPEGAEVALFGVNYYPQSWYQFENLRRLGVDVKPVIRQDLDHLVEMSVDIIRIHVFDREITDGAGNIIPNIHLDLLDYLAAECSKRGIYLYFTPIAWWGGPNERPDSFSAQTSKPGMMFVPAAKAAAARYLGQFLSRVNRYSGRAYRDEPCLCLLEAQNEPAYFQYSDMTGNGYAPQGETPVILARDRGVLQSLWREWLTSHKLTDSPVYFPLFRYELMRSYVHEMIAAIRGAGAHQPIAISTIGVNGEELIQAIADSECDAVTYSEYPGGWAQVNDGINQLPQIGPLKVDPRFSQKARLAYEFDAPATNVSCYAYPAIAASFRAGEVQAACQFQYDSATTARWNTDWNAHWLNWWYTPTKAASYMAAREAFHRIPRGKQYKTGAQELILSPMAVSFTHNQSLLAAPDMVIHARTLGDWRPLSLPHEPAAIIGTGSSPFVSYGGTGIYKLKRMSPSRFHLTLNPDARLVGNCLQGSFSSPVAELERNRQWFSLKLPGWEDARCIPLTGENPKPINKVDGGWVLLPGEYEIRR
ncbi:MAG TPA: hypothetical protein VFJ58_04015 [Armatimonadota bacterium]|nr:hypothetical protein [Armatimonadota bacterium]